MRSELLRRLDASVSHAGATARIAIAVCSMWISGSVYACSPSSSSYKRDLKLADVAIRGKYRLETNYEDERVIGNVIIRPTKIIKRFKGLPYVGEFVVPVNEPSLSDGINCPAWFFNEENRYFLFKVDAHGRSTLIGAYRK